MDNPIAVRVDNVSKIFKLYDKQLDYALDLLPFSKKRSRDFYALKNISFELKRGDFLGIVGRNGAGKSTLLKILSEELVPTTGKVEINGTVSLLQLGTGFNKELTGRENAIFASKILGYSNKEIAQILPKIIEFAEIGDFIDQPLKTYSSGMHSRLSFAVGININPDILIADEVLSVGDIRFSQKCLRKMHEFKAQGKTLILVTHDTTSVGVFCNKAIWIMDGEIRAEGNAIQVAEDYKNYMLYGRTFEHTDTHTKSPKKMNLPEVTEDAEKVLNANLELVDLSKSSQIGNGKAQILRGNIFNVETLKPQRLFHPHQSLYLVCETKTFNDLENCTFGYLMQDKNALITLHSNNTICNKHVGNINKNHTVRTVFKITLPALNSGQFVFALSLFSDDEAISRLHEVFPIEVYNSSSKQRQLGYVYTEDEDFSIKASVENKTTESQT